MKYLVGALCVLGMLVPATSFGQEVFQELNDIVEAKVLAITDERVEQIMGTDAEAVVQTVEAVFTSGEEIGRKVEFENDLISLKPGDSIYITHIITINGDEYFTLKDVVRHNELWLLLILFVFLLVWFARWQGVRALASLALSVAAILFLLIPAMLKGYDPVWISLVIAGVILTVVLLGTHGVNPLSLSALGGTLAAVFATSVIAAIFVEAMQLTGFGSDAAVALNFSTDGQLDFSGLLLGSIIIGILGVLDDVSITQASVVGELRRANHELGISELYQRAIKVGRDHVGSLVNTLALAYVGAALPLVLLFATSNESIAITLNQEVIASEIVRIIVGSIGLILAVPLTTIIAAWWFSKHEVDESQLTHSHSHGHHH